MKFTRNRLRVLPISALLMVAGFTAQQSSTPASAQTNVAAVCTTGPNFQLVADLGYIFTPDGNLLPMWSYADVAGNASTFQYPGPVLCVNQGDTVTVTLTNNLPEATSLVFPGQDSTTVNGAAAEPVLNSAGTITSLAPIVASGATLTYSFVASKPGTYLYTSGTNPDKQREMGMFGAIIVRPGGSLTSLYGDASPTDDFTAGREFLQILSEADPAFHAAVENGDNPPTDNLVSKYFFINGRSMPDTISPNDSPFLPAQPYSGLIHIVEGQKAGIRYVNMGRSHYPFHPHGNDTIVVGHDGSMLKGQTTADAGQDLSFPKFLIDLAPGQTVDATYTWTDAEHYTPANPVPVVLPQIQQQSITGDTWYAMSPYLGFRDTSQLPAGVRQTSECGEYYHMAHSHALQQATTYGAAFGGMMTLYRIDPLSGPGRIACP